MVGMRRGIASASLLASVLALLIILMVGTSSAWGDQLQAGVGRADITPPTGYFFQGWVRSDAVGDGQNTRLYARAVVLQQGTHKLALVAEDVNGIPGGALQAAAQQLKPYGFTEQNIVDSASHTHAAPGQFYNFPSYDTVFMTDSTPTKQNVAGAIDPQLYAFEVRQLVAAIRRADNNLGPARAAWGHTQLLGLTQNRSLEAHLANFGISEPPGSGSVSQDPGGYPNTIDPDVEVLRVDKLLAMAAPARAAPVCRRRASHGPLRKRRCHNKRGAHRYDHAHARVTRRSRRPHRPRRGHAQAVMRYVPVGMWSNFSDHGTVNKASFHFYNADHQGPAMRVIEGTLRREGHVPAGQDVVDAFGNADEGDVTAGIMHTGPADADLVGRREAAAMLTAWREAGSHLSPTMAVDERWTRLCFCGQGTLGGTVDSSAEFGFPQLTGSEEGRGPLYDNTHVSHEGDHLPVDANPVQGDKIASARPPALDVPQAVPVLAVRLGDRMLVSIPGELTVTMGQRVKRAVMAVAGPAGVSQVVIAGLTNEYLSYFTTPEEYQAQHYEGGSNLYGRYSSNLLEQTLVDLSARLVRGAPAPAPYPFDPTHGVSADAAPFGTGATQATITGQPQPVARLAHAHFAWHGGGRGLDRPVDGPFVSIRRQVAGRWLPVTNDLGVRMLWGVDDQGAYNATWEVPLDAVAGQYEFVVSANHYRLESAPFAVDPTSALSVRRIGTSGAHLSLDYPPASPEQDITYRPVSAASTTMTAVVNGRAVSAVSSGPDGVVTVPAPAGSRVAIAAGAAHDAYANSNAAAVSFVVP